MRIWLELNAQEAERIFDSVKEMTIDRMDTGIVKAKEAETVGKSEDEAELDAPGNGEGEKPLSLVNLRAALHEIAKDGKKALVKDLIKRYGAERLTDIDPIHYPQLLKEAEAL